MDDAAQEVRDLAHDEVEGQANYHGDSGAEGAGI